MFIAAVLVVIGFPLTGISYTHPLFLGFIATNTFIVTFLFGTGAWKSIYDCMVFLYVIYPFDVEDECEIENQEVRQEIVLFSMYCTQI